MVSVRTEKAARNYSGETARNYEAKRIPQPKWQREQEILEQMIKALPAETTVLDCPCGTGRLFPFFVAAGCRGWAVDISEDMLREARKAAASCQMSGVATDRASIFDLPFRDVQFDVTFAIRIMNKIGKEDVPAALKELQRVTRHSIIFNLRLPGNPRMRHPVPMEVVEGALEPGWRVADSVEIHEPDFRMITLRREQARELD